MKQKFQFQYGTIKRIEITIENKGISKFQFQYGTIKSGAKYYNNDKDLRFNSNMVRLKGFIGWYLAIANPVFQFQFGTIKRHFHQFLSPY